MGNTSGNKLAMVLAVLGSLALVACEDNGVVASDVAGEWWLVSFVRSEGSTASVTGSPLFRVRFDADGAMSLLVNCNTCRGSYQLQSGQLTSDVMDCTLALCEPTSVDPPPPFQNVFEGRSSATLPDGHL